MVTYGGLGYLTGVRGAGYGGKKSPVQFKAATKTMEKPLYLFFAVYRISAEVAARKRAPIFSFIYLCFSISFFFF